MSLHAVWSAPIAPSSLNDSTAVSRAAGLYRGVEQTPSKHDPFVCRSSSRTVTRLKEVQDKYLDAAV
jgi:hypothetical protein